MVQSRGTKNVCELVRALVDNVAAFGSKSKLWRDLRLKRAVQNWNMKICRHCEESRVSGGFTSSERLANRLKINKTGAV